MKRLFFAAALVSLAAVATAQSEYWRDAQGQPVADTASRKSKEGFAGWLLVTPDEDWKEKWDTPSSSTPFFNEANVVERGKRLFALTFFANPALGVGGEANVACDLTVVRPDGSISVNERGLVCYRGQLRGNPSNLYLSAPILAFVGEPADLAGTWTIEVTLRDNTRNVELPLVSTYQLR